LQQSAISPNSTVILIDESLADKALAIALSAVDYNAIASTVQLGSGALDPTIIQWLGFQGGLWVTADFDSKRKHADAIKNASINILWIERPKNGGFPKRSQPRLVISVIDPVLNEIAKSRCTCFFIAKFNGDKPKCIRI